MNSKKVNAADDYERYLEARHRMLALKNKSSCNLLMIIIVLLRSRVYFSILFSLAPDSLEQIC